MLNNLIDSLGPRYQHATTSSVIKEVIHLNRESSSMIGLQYRGPPVRMAKICSPIRDIPVASKGVVLKMRWHRMNAHKARKHAEQRRATQHRRHCEPPCSRQGPEVTTTIASARLRQACHAPLLLQSSESETN